ncbi:uncharacterized protein BKA78DRAFT_313631, partial [Phyllosticta capitalensis]|uniref:uncharacterized protein n=1 Tax=Phyllosticta capitalensis TaxID=121624 RepID=UPI00312CC6EC
MSDGCRIRNDVFEEPYEGDTYHSKHVRPELRVCSACPETKISHAVLYSCTWLFDCRRPRCLVNESEGCACIGWIDHHHHHQPPLLEASGNRCARATSM